MSMIMELILTIITMIIFIMEKHIKIMKRSKKQTLT